ncbi:GGDEF domain-containing protein [Paenibacillus mesophilus]|uniref:GGDEF domain-containing protein n=1 Tax=Paenibacillus mesophilus TaxID=2582849 RepID=UPI00110DC232|nr:GGDEF domain-containing protein [Paenibacillus mesophilus]TMV49431.1 GGDEF domain-containing protein [Paenibacillus mesophilus]
MYNWKKRFNLHLDPDLEEEFEHYYVSKHLSILRFGLIVSLGLFALLGIDDIWAAPLSKHEIWGIRYGIMMPFFLISYGLTYTRVFRRHLQSIMCVVQLFSGCGSIGIMAVLKPEEPANYFYFAGLMLILFGNFTLFGLRWIQATTVSVVLAAGYAVTVLFVQQPFQDGIEETAYLAYINSNLYLLSTFLGSAVVGYVMERYKIVEFAQRKELERKNEVMERLSYQDGLTGVSNRRAFDARIAEEWNWALRNARCVSLIMIDIDHFKLYNDTYGHQQGDECLRAVAGALRNSLKRSKDFIARYGGEEFAVILPETDEEGVQKLSEYLHQAVNDLRLGHESSRFGIVTISAGAATAWPEDGDYREMIEAADRALYESKSNGRNRTTVSGYGKK